jgi:hypothetical protein
VGATTIEEEITTFSGRGPSPFGVIKPNVSAPGKDVISTFPGGSYKSLDGTSMAAPHVAGVVALLLQADPTLAENGLADITNAITTTAVPLGSSFPNNNFGWGRVDAYNAVLSVASSGLLVGTVTQPNGTPVAQAIVQITSKGGGPILTTSTGAAGTYLQGIAAGNYDVTVLAFGFEPTTVFNIAITTNATTTQDFVLTPSPRGTLQGTIRDKSTNTLLAATITVNGTPASTTSNPANGQYSLSLPVGTYNLTVVAPEHRLGQAFNLTINDGATINQDFSLDPAPSILLIDSGKWYQESKIGYFQQALTDNLYPYDLLQISGPFNHPSDVPITSTLTSYDIVIWSAPQDSPGYVGAGAALKGYLDQGGKLLLSGQDVAFFDGGGDIFTYAPYLYSHLRGEGKLAPDFVVTADTAAGDCHPGAAIPVLHFITAQPVTREGHRFRGFHRRVVIILERYYVDLADGLAAVELHFQPGGKTGTIGGPVTILPDEETFAVTVDGPRGGKAGKG